MHNIKTKYILLLVVALVLPVFFSCSIEYEKPIVIWTNRAEFAVYAELFNTTQNNAKAVVVYKENPAEAFPPTKDEQKPDIVIGEYLKNEKIRRNFIPLDYLFIDQHLKKNIFYPQLLELGNVDSKQYLLPVSFNLPAVMFSKEQSSEITDNYMLSPNEIRDIAAKANKKKKSGIGSMGFAPRWTPEFMYQVIKGRGADFKESEEIFSWDKESIQESIDYFKKWTTDINFSADTEIDFQFKYLYTPELEWITTGKCLFAYTTSSKLFSVSPEKIAGVDFRWLQNDEKIYIDDGILSMGLYKYSSNAAAAEHFIIWFMNEKNQKDMLQWKEDLNLYTRTFGIAQGFSAIRNVNEQVYPVFYPGLFGNLPATKTLVTPNILPSKWLSIKERIIIPYILNALTATPVDTVPIETLLSEWKKQFF